MGKHRGEPVFKYEVDWLESERGWGQDTWTTVYDTREEAQKEIDRSKPKPGPTPDYYIIPVSEIREVVQ